MNEGGGSKKMIYIGTGLFILILALSAWGAMRMHTSLVNEAVKANEKIIRESFNKQIKDYQDIIDEKNKELEVSRKKYSKLVGKIKDKAKEADQIKAPGDINETRKRFGSLGYKPLSPSGK